MAVRPFRFGARSDESDDESTSLFEVAGYVSNPFPDPGLDTGAFYRGHMSAQVTQIEAWVHEVDVSTDLEHESSGPVRPLAVRGSIGVGKTHLLKALEAQLSSRDHCAVVRKNIPEEGMDRLLLATLLLNSLPRGDESVELPKIPSALPLLDRIVAVARSKGDRALSVRSTLERLTTSLIARPLLRVVDEVDESRESDLRAWLARWLLRGHTTPVQRNKLGLTKPLEGEGQAIQAVADLLRVARATGGVQTWFVLFDQLEDLWRAGVISAGRRARFLTDLRFLIDLGLEGAPIAVLLAWNTEVDHTRLSGEGEDRLEREYQALWRRLGDPVDLPGLQAEDIWPFAKEYLKHGSRAPGQQDVMKALRAQFREGLEEKTKGIVAALRQDPRARLGPQRFASYRVLYHWREAAATVAKTMAGLNVS